MFKFGVDAMLGKIAKILRFYGFDTKYFRDKKDMEILAECIRDGRVLITSDEGLYNLGKGWNLKSVYIKYPYKDPWDVAKEIIRSLGARPEPFTRCPRCNGVLNKVSKWDIEGFVHPFVWNRFEEFAVCSECGQIYWEGTHYDKILRRIEER